MEESHGGARMWIEALIVSCLFLFFTNSFVLGIYYIPSGSMEETLLVGDRVVVDRFIYGDAPTALERALLPLRPVERGDVVVFRYPEDPTVTFVKRCVAIPGDTVEIIAKQLYVNGEPVDESGYAVHRHGLVGGVDSFDPRLVQRDNLPRFTVPEGEYFCLGDNRDNSLDSRYWGTVPRSAIVARPALIYWSYDFSIGETEGLAETARRVVDKALFFLRDTKWRRVLDVVY